MTNAMSRTARRPALRGIVTAIVAVTGVEDEVADIIQPGAFTATLKKRRPKVCYMHDWKKPIGRVLTIVELKPGDKRLPTHLPDGREWPEGGGALIAVMQFHLNTAGGREAFEHARQWHVNGEAAFSIGYRVPDGMSSKRGDGVRIIYALDLFEVSLVLHGAHTMALALEVKSADGADVPVREIKVSAEQAVEVPSDSVMVALYPSADAAEALKVDGGEPAKDLHITLALPGAGASMDQVAAVVAQVLADHDPLTGHVGGLGIFPPGPGSDGIPIWRTVDVPGLAELRHDLVAALTEAGYAHQSEHGWTPHMTIGYSLPSVAPIENVPVTFDHVTVVLGDNGSTDRVDLPLGGRREPAPMSGKAALAVYEARLLNAYIEGKSAEAAVIEAKMLNAATVDVPTLGKPHKTPLRKRRTRPDRPQEVTA